jgi:hypothetical protein
MSAVKWFMSNVEVNEACDNLRKEYPGAHIVVDGVMWKIAGDYACTKFLHEDGHVY